MKKKSELPIGLDVGEAGVRMLQLCLVEGGVTAKAAAFAPMPSDLKPSSEAYGPALSAAIQSAFAAGGFAGHAVVSALPASMVQCKNLRLPMMPADELASAVKWEAADRFRMAPEQCSLQYLHAGQVSQGDEVRQELILFAAKLSQIEAHVAAMTDQGLKPLAIDSIPTALARLAVMRHALRPDARSESAVDVMIDFGQSATKVLIAVDGQVRFYKSIEIGGAKFDSVLSGELSMSLDAAGELRRGLSAATDQGEAEDQPASAEDAKQRRAVVEALRSTLNELAREIGLCLRYYGVTFRGARPAEAQLIGGGATPWLAEALGDSAGLSLSLENVLGAVDLSAVRDVIRPGTEGAWAVAAGLSIREHMKHFNTKPAGPLQAESSVFQGDSQGKEVAA